MPSIALLIESGATPSSVTATLDLFRIASRFDPDAPFRIDRFSVQGGAVALSEALHLQTCPLPDKLAGYDAVIVPGFFAADETDLTRQLASVWQPAISRLNRLGTDSLVAASCYGTFVLAESGRLDGHAATTTWWQEGLFNRRYPEVRLDVAQSLIDDGGVITAGAMTAHTDLSLHVLRRLKGYSLARQVGSVMLVDEARASQRPFMAVQRRFADPLIDSAIAWMECHVTEPFSATDLAEAVHVSYRTLHRQFRTIVGKPPLTYLQAMRVEHAKTLLEQTRKSVEQIAVDVGYHDASSFRRLFTRQTSLSPAQYRRQFRRGTQ